MNNPYKVLGVNEGASQEEIRSAYLKLVKKYHPDKYTDSELKELANEKLVEVNEAYEMLTKKTVRAQATPTGTAMAPMTPTAADIPAPEAHIPARMLRNSTGRGLSSTRITFRPPRRCWTPYPPATPNGTISTA